MRIPPEEFEAYLAPGESVVEGVPGTIAVGSYRSAGAIGVTDRRLLFVSDGDRFMDVAHGSICSIRSDPRTTLTAAGIGYPLIAVVGALVAVGGVAGVAALGSGPLALALALTTVGGAVAAEYARRMDLSIPRGATDALRGVTGSDVRVSLGALSHLRSLRRGRPASVGNDALVLGIGLVSLFALVGLVAVVGSLLVLPLVVASLVGIAGADVGYRQARRLDAAGDGSRRRERAVTIHLVDGRVVALRVDDADRIDRSLSGVVRSPGRRDVAPGSGSTATRASGSGR